MKPTILNKIKNEKCLLVLYTFQNNKVVNFFDIFVNELDDDKINKLKEILSNVKNSGYEIYETKDSKVNFPDGKNYNICIKFVIFGKDLSKIYKDIKDLFYNYEE